MSIPKIIHWVWLGPNKISDRNLGFMEGVKKLHPGWEFRLWTNENLSGLNQSVSEIVTPAHSLASASNLVRLIAVYKFGGIYLDVDVEGIKPLDSLLVSPKGEMISNSLLVNAAFAGIQDHAGGRDRLCNAVFGAIPNHPWIVWQLDFYDRIIRESADYGVDLMSDAPRRNVTVLPREVFYPWLWTDECRMMYPETILAHHWNGSWVGK